MSELSTFYAALERCLRSTQETLAVATIIRTRGSSPREVGAKMLVRPNGDTDGTVGGGCGEAEVWRTALDVMADQQPRTVVVDLTGDISMDTDGVCGGVIDIFVEPWSAGSPGPPGRAPGPGGTGGLALAGAVLAAVGARRTAVTATVVAQSAPGLNALGAKLLFVEGAECAGGLPLPALRRAVVDDLPSIVAGGRSLTKAYALPEGQVSVFFEVATPRPTLIVVGAGHVAVPIARVGTLLDFDVVVVDDRPAFANRERFPDASEIVVDDFAAALERLPITPATYVVLVTRGHAHDVRSLRTIVAQPAAYIGMIGSQRRVFAVFKLLRDEGVPVEALLQVRAPIGLDLNTETPGEIAVSVGAELLKARRGGAAASRSERLRAQYLYALTAADPVSARQ